MAPINFHTLTTLGLRLELNTFATLTLKSDFLSFWLLMSLTTYNFDPYWSKTLFFLATLAPTKPCHIYDFKSLTLNFDFLSFLLIMIYELHNLQLWSHTLP